MIHSNLLRPAARYNVAGMVFLSLLLALAVSFTIGLKRQPLYLHMKVKAAQGTVFQLFYDQGQGHNEQHSRKRVVREAGENTVIRFPLPPQPIRSLRLDFVSQDKELQISSIDLVNDINQVVHQYDIHELAALRDIAPVRVQDRKAQVMADGPDPQLQLGRNSPVPNRYGFPWPLFFSLTPVVHAVLWLAGRLFSLLFRRRTKGYHGSRRSSPGRITGIFHLFMITTGLLLIGSLAGFLLLEKNTVPDGYQQGHELIPFEEFNAGTQVAIKRSDGLNIAGTLYAPAADAAPAPAVLLLHGNYPEGRYFPLYPVLAQFLARRGYLVLTLDFAGYGESGDPFTLGRPESVNMDLETRAALRFLEQQPGVDRRTGIMVIGHSMGADPALSVGVGDQAVRSLVLIGPPRRVQERFRFPPDVDFFWNWALHVRRKLYRREGFPEWYSREEWRQQILERDMVHFLPYFSGWGHKPLLLIDGEREPGPDMEFLKRYACQSAYPKKYVTLVKADHNCNVSARGKQVMYDPVVMEQLVGEIDSWNQQSGTGVQTLRDVLGNTLRRLFSLEVIQDC